MAGALYVTIVNYLRKGKDGKDGEDGVVVRITPDTLVFATDDNGEIKSASLSQKAQIKVYKGSEDITASCTFADKNAVFVNCQGYVSKSVVGGSAVGLVQFSAINTAATVDGHKIPSTAGYANISIPCTLDGKTYMAQVKFTVDGGSFWGGLSSTSKGLVASYTSISDRMDDAEGEIDSLNTANGNLTKRVGTLEVTSGRISAKVNQTEVRDRNLIPNSYVNQGSGIYGFCKRKIRLEKGKSYAMSIWGRIDNTLSARGGSMRAYVYKENSSGTWTYTQYVDLTSTTDSKAETKWTHVGETGEYQFAVFPYPRKDDGGGKCFLQCAQIEKIEDAANGYGTAWSANNDDAVALGNVLPDIRSNAWTFGNGAAIAPDKAEIEGRSLDVVVGVSSSSAELDVMGLGKILTLGRGSVYTMSFWAQGRGSFNSYLYNDSSNGCSWAVRDDGNWSEYIDGAVLPDRTLSNEWKRYSVTFSVDTDVAVGFIPVRLRKNGMVAIAGLKLEPYGRATEYTNRAITTEEMLATGIDIFNRKVIVTADNFEVRNNLGQVTAKVDADGQLTAGILTTKNRGEGYIKAEDGLLKVFNGQGLMNIRFGIDPNSGMMVMSYYDNEGHLLYDLGPDGIRNRDLQNSVLTAYTMERLGTFFNNPYRFSIDMYSDDVYSYDSNGNRIIDSKFKARLMPDSTTGEGYIPESALKKWETRFYYRSAKVADAFIKDDENGITTGELAKQANDKWFLQKPICVDGTLKVIQSGEYVMRGAALHYSQKIGEGVKSLAITFMDFDDGVRSLYDVFLE